MRISKKNAVILFFSATVLVSMSLIILVNEDNSDESNDAALVQGNKNLAETQLADNEAFSKILKVSVSMNPAQFSALQTASRDFEMNHSDIRVLLNNLPSAASYLYFKTLARTGELPDVMLLDNTWVKEFAVKGYLSHEADQFFMGETLAQYLDPMLNQDKWNGYLWAVPYQVDPYIFVWNKHRFAEQGIHNPPSTVQELLEYNTLFQDAKHPSGLYFDFDDPYAFITLVLTLRGGNGGKKEAFPLIDDQTSEWLQQLLFVPQQALNDGKNGDVTTNYPASEGPWNMWEELQQGNIVMTIGKASEFIRLTKNLPSDELAVAILPSLQSGHADKLDSHSDPAVLAATWLSGTSFGVSSNSEIAEKAFEWIKAVTTSQQQAFAQVQEGAFPILVPLYDTDLFRSEPNYAAISDVIRFGKTLNTDPDFPEKVAKIHKAMNLWFHGTMDLEQFKDAYNQSWSSLVGVDF